MSTGTRRLEFATYVYVLPMREPFPVVCDILRTPLPFFNRSSSYVKLSFPQIPQWSNPRVDAGSNVSMHKGPWSNNLFTRKDLRLECLKWRGD
jgi:hypothetical protein